MSGRAVATGSADEQADSNAMNPTHNKALLGIILIMPL
jgi:hypothetical protein